MEKVDVIDDYLNRQKRRVLYLQMGEMGLQLVPYTMYQIFEDGDKQLEVAKRIEDNCPSDFIYPMDLGMAFLEKLGIPLKKPEYDFPSVEKGMVLTEEQVKKLPQIELYEDKIVSEYIRGLHLIVENIEKPMMAAVVGPFTMAGEMAGVSHWVKATIKDATYVDALMNYCTEYVMKLVEETIKSGATVIQISEPTCVCVRPAYFEKNIVPFLKRIFDRIHQSGRLSALHICGNTKKHLPGMLKTECQIIGVDQVMSIKEMMQEIPDNVVLAGNIDPVKTMLQGTPEEVRRKTEELLDSMEGHKNFMPSFGCDCPINTPIENLNMVIDIVKGWKIKE